MPDPLHVVHAVLSLDVGGLERIVVSLVRAGVARGQRVTVVCVERPGQFAKEAEAAGGAVVSLDKPPGRLSEFVGRAAALLHDLRPNVIHTHQIGATWYLGPPARHLEIPVLHTEHGNHFARARSWTEAFKSRLLYRQAGGFVDRFCCVSSEIAASVSRWRTVPRRKVEVVPNGIDTGPPPGMTPPDKVRTTLGIPLGAPVVGTVGRLNEVKRQDLLVRAVAGLRGRFPDVRLLLVGDGLERANLGRLADALGVGERVHFAGYQPCPEKFLRAMTVFALTSRTEGFPVSLLEAWAAGVPVVATAVGGIPDVVTDGVNARLVPSGQEAALIATLTDVLSDPVAAAALGRSGREEVSARYSLDRIAGEYERHYRELIATKTGNR